jgi:CRISPR-associated protein Csd2
MPSNIVSRRHDILVLFDVTNGNPNGDPDAGNLPRIDPTTNKGLVSDVCLKRKVRNFVTQFPPSPHDGYGFDVFVRQGAILNDLIDTSEPPATQRANPATNRDDFERAALDWLCRKFFDLRAFGAVLSTKNKVFKGSAYGQVRGPIQFTFGRSVDPITPIEISITRCAATNADEKKANEAADSGTGGNRTMGNKHIVPYALYVAKAFVSPVFAERTSFTDEDLELFFEALQHMFDHDQSAARADMTVRGIYDFEHVGTQAEPNAAQNVREAKLGCAHAWKLFEGVHIPPAKKEFPESFADYVITDDWPDKTCGDVIVPGVKIYRRVDPRRPGNSSV